MDNCLGIHINELYFPVLLMLFFSLIYLSGQINKGDFLNLFAVEPALNKVMYTNQQLHSVEHSYNCRVTFWNRLGDSWTDLRQGVQNELILNSHTT